VCSGRRGYSCRSARITCYRCRCTSEISQHQPIKVWAKIAHDFLTQSHPRFDRIFYDKSFSVVHSRKQKVASQLGDRIGRLSDSVRTHNKIVTPNSTAFFSSRSLSPRCNVAWMTKRIKQSCFALKIFIYQNTRWHRKNRKKQNLTNLCYNIAMSIYLSPKYQCKFWCLRISRTQGCHVVI